LEVQFNSLEEFKTELNKALTTNGYYLKVENPDLKLQTTIELSFSIAGKEDSFKIKAEIVFLGGGGAGFNFIERTDNLKDRFNNFLTIIEGEATKPPQASEETIPQAQETPKAVEPQPQQPLEQQPEPIKPQEFSPQAPSQAQPVPPTEEVETTPQVETHVITGKMINTLKLDSGKAGERNLLADFGDLSFSKILINVFEGKSTGVITLKRGDLEKIVYFRKGKPIFVDSNPPLLEESIGHIFVSKGKIKKEDLDKSIKYVEENGVRLGEALVALKLASPTLVKDALTYQLRIKLFELFKWKDADFEMQLMPSLNQKFGTRPINVINTIYRGLKEKLKDLYPIELEPFISPIYDKYLTQKENPLFDLENLGLNNKERRFWDLMLTGKRRIRQIFEGSTMNKPDTFRFLYALLELDLVNINEQATLDIPNIERDLYTQARLMEQMNHYDILFIHWSADKEKVDAAYQKHSTLTLDKKKTPGLSPESHKNIDRMLATLKKAHEVLCVDSARREYRKQILGESESKIAAELAARQAQLMEFKGDMKEARNLIVVALDLDPGNHIYRQLSKRYGVRK